MNKKKARLGRIRICGTSPVVTFLTNKSQVAVVYINKTTAHEGAEPYDDVLWRNKIMEASSRKEAFALGLELLGIKNSVDL